MWTKLCWHHLGVIVRDHTIFFNEGSNQVDSLDFQTRSRLGAESEPTAGHEAGTCGGPAPIQGDPGPGADSFRWASDNHWQAVLES